MPLIDKTYFVGDISIPAKTYDNLDLFIARYEKELLIRLFGMDIYTLIAAYNPEDEPATPENILDIIKGKEFIENDITYRWNGLINTEKISPIAYYVYYHYMRHSVSHTSTTGEIKSKHKHSDPADITNKVSLAWFKLKELIGEHGYLGYHIDNYTYYNSLFYFMNKNLESYPTWRCTYIGSVNSFDL
jgi:hypothetical protein